MNSGNKTENLWTFIGKRLNAEAALADWRLMLGDKLDFDKMQRQYLAPTGKIARAIMCAEACSPSCGFRKVCEWEEKYEAVCREWPLKSYDIEKADTVFFTVNPDDLLPEIAKIFKITPHIDEFNNENDTWKLGVVPVPGQKPATVYLTLKSWNHDIMDLVFRLNSEERRPYILLVTARKVIHGTSEKVLNDMGSAFVPLNEVLDFNSGTELEFIRECSLPQLIAPPVIEAEPEPDNIFRKCGDAWEVRFDGGEKFMLTGVDTGARYIHHLLRNPCRAMTAVNIVREITGEGALPEEFKDMADGFSVSTLPAGSTGKVADFAAIREYREEERRLSLEIENAADSSNNVRILQLQKDLKMIRTAINQAVSPAGQQKLLGDLELRIANSFRNSVNYAVKRIARHDESLASHFRKTIKCGRFPEYTPESDIDWKF